MCMLAIHALYKNLVIHKIRRTTAITVKKIKPSIFFSSINTKYSALNLYLPIINKSRDISITSRIDNVFAGMSFCYSTHVTNMSTNVIEIFTVFFSVSGTDTNQVSISKKKQKPTQRKKLNVEINWNLSRLLCTSFFATTSPIYSHTNVPRRMSSPALTPHP